MNRLSPVAVFLVSVMLLLLIWQVAATLYQDRALPDILTVLNVMGAAIDSGELPRHLSITLARVGASFFLVMVIGSAIGLAMGRAGGLNRFFDPWLVFFLNLPALVTVILCYIWFGLTETAAILAVMISKVPNVAVTIREGARALDPQYAKLAQVYRFSRWTTLRYVILPQLVPFLTGSARSGLALVWKIVLVVELLGRSNGIGFQIHLHFQLFDVASILAYTIAFIVVVQTIELGIFIPLERRANRWRL